MQAMTGAAVCVGECTPPCSSTPQQQTRSYNLLLMVCHLLSKLLPHCTIRDQAKNKLGITRKQCYMDLLNALALYGYVVNKK